MGRIIAVEYVTLDGVFEEPAWSGPYFNDELGAWQDRNLREADAPEKSFVLDRRARREESGDALGPRRETQKTSDRQ